jgi:hypothetical protein
LAGVITMPIYAITMAIHVITMRRSARSRCADPSDHDDAVHARAAGHERSPGVWRRLIRAYEASGEAALMSKRRGKPSNRKLPDALRAAAVELVREHHPDFDPRLAAEKLREVHRGGTVDFQRWIGDVVHSRRAVVATAWAS